MMISLDEVGLPAKGDLQLLGLGLQSVRDSSSFAVRPLLIRGVLDVLDDQVTVSQGW